jgi:hypothetical protein
VFLGTEDAMGWTTLWILAATLIAVVLVVTYEPRDKREPKPGWSSACVRAKPPIVASLKVAQVEDGRFRIPVIGAVEACEDRRVRATEFELIINLKTASCSPP